MIRALSSITVAVLLAGCAGTAPLGRGERAATDYDRQILLTLPGDGAMAAAFGGQPGKRYLRRRSYGPPASIDQALDALAAKHRIERVEGWPIRSLGIYCEVFRVPDGIVLDGLIAALMSDPRVDLVQRMNLFETLTSRYDDPYAGLQSSVLQLGLEQAHELATGKGVTVAVIDSAVDASHPDLMGHVRVGYDLVGRDTALRGEVHGTAVAGIIASTAGNSEGIVGIAPDVDIAALRACWAIEPGGSAARCSSFSLAQALETALDLEPGVINLSLAGPSDSLLERLLAEAIRRGIIVVTAEPEHAGGDAFPASLPAAPHHLLAAPASEILTTVPQAGYAFMSGSSLAAAHVSGVIALLLERSPSISAADVAALLTQTAVGTVDAESINACGALEELTRVLICDAPPEVAGNQHYSPANP
jgi:hypothetical protein